MVSRSNSGISLIDEKPKEILFINLEGVHLNTLMTLRDLSLIEVTAVIVDLQADFQISKSFNKACVVTQRPVKKTNVGRLNWWGNTQTKPFLKVVMNFFSHSNTQLINIRAKIAKLILNLDGAAFSRLYPLATLVYNILMQGMYVFFPEHVDDELIREKLAMDTPKQTLIKKYHISIQECEVDLFMEKVPELISSLSNDYVAKIISMLFSDICYFPIKMKELNIDTVGHYKKEQAREQRRYLKDFLRALLISGGTSFD